MKEVVTTPGKYVVKSGEVYEKTINELNPLVAAAEVGLAASGFSDLNDSLRFTRGQESIKRRQAKILELMEKENAKSEQEAITCDEKTGNSNIKTNNTRVKKLREVKSFQRSNKSKQRFYEHSGEAMRRASEIKAEKEEGITVFEGVTGSKKEDEKSGYDENLIGVNKKETPVEERY